MKILGIDSSTSVASVAIVCENNIIAEYTVDHKKTHSQTLLSMIDEIANMTETNLCDIDAIAVSGGPGSFTGLRIGSATAKGLGFALDKPLIHVPTIDALAYNFCGTKLMVCPMIDARRSQVYTGIYRCNSSFETIYPQDLVMINDIVDRLNELNEPVLLLGDGIINNEQYIKENLKVSYSFAPLHMNRNKAASVAALGIEYLSEGKIEKASKHLPNYLRPSQAERELKEKQEQ